MLYAKNVRGSECHDGLVQISPLFTGNGKLSKSMQIALKQYRDRIFHSISSASAANTIYDGDKESEGEEDGLNTEDSRKVSPGFSGNYLMKLVINNQNPSFTKEPLFSL